VIGRAETLSDPSGASVLVAAAQWIEGTLLGSIATIVAVIAVAWLGLMMLDGRLELRRGLVVLVGCFVLFGAPVIANGLRDPGASDVLETASAPPLLVVPILPPENGDERDPFHPYAGAAVPIR
jgi:type IV secretory pathway VirB2 component (pilin)